MEINTGRGIAQAVSTSALALAATMPAQLNAQDTGITNNAGLAGLKISVDGGASFSNFTEEFWTDGGAKLGSLDEDIGYYGSIAVSKSIANAWDWRVTATHIGMPETSNLFTSGSDAATLGGKFSATNVDFDLGKSMDYGSTDVRFGFGLTGTRVNQTVNKGFITSGGAANGDYGTSFTGFGAKISADVSRPFNEASPYRLIAGGSVAAMRGKYTADKGISATSGGGGGTFEISDSATGGLLTESLYLGMAYDFSTNSSMRFGIRADRFDSSDVTYFGGSNTTGLLENPVLVKTAFVGVDIQF